MPFHCVIVDANGTSAHIHVPDLKETWSIHSTGMVGNLSNWPIYDLHPDDCAMICKANVHP